MTKPNWLLLFLLLATTTGASASALFEYQDVFSREISPLDKVNYFAPAADNDDPIAMYFLAKSFDDLSSDVASLDHLSHQGDRYSALSEEWHRRAKAKLREASKKMPDREIVLAQMLDQEQEHGEHENEIIKLATSALRGGSVTAFHFLQETRRLADLDKTDWEAFVDKFWAHYGTLLSRAETDGQAAYEIGMLHAYFHFEQDMDELVVPVAEDNVVILHWENAVTWFKKAASLGSVDGQLMYVQEESDDEFYSTEYIKQLAQLFPEATTKHSGYIAYRIGA